MIFIFNFLIFPIHFTVHLVKFGKLIFIGYLVVFFRKFWYNKYWYESRHFFYHFLHRSSLEFETRLQFRMILVRFYTLSLALSNSNRILATWPAQSILLKAIRARISRLDRIFLIVFRSLEMGEKGVQFFGPSFFSSRKLKISALTF